MCSEAEVYYGREPEMVARKGESDLILNAREGDRTRACKCVGSANQISRLRPGEWRRPRIGDMFREGCR